MRERISNKTEKNTMSQSQINSASQFTVSQSINSASGTSVSEYTTGRFEIVWKLSFHYEPHNVVYNTMVQGIYHGNIW